MNGNQYGNLDENTDNGQDDRPGCNLDDRPNDNTYSWQNQLTTSDNI
jgi:hypothetical protein